MSARVLRLSALLVLLPSLVHAHALTLAWDGMAPAYRIQRQAGPPDAPRGVVRLWTVPGTQRAWRDRAPLVGQVSTYTVTAVDGARTSLPSTPLVVDIRLWHGWCVAFPYRPVRRPVLCGRGER